MFKLCIKLSFCLSLYFRFLLFSFSIFRPKYLSVPWSLSLTASVFLSVSHTFSLFVVSLFVSLSLSFLCISVFVICLSRFLSSNPLSVSYDIGICNQKQPGCLLSLSLSVSLSLSLSLSLYISLSLSLTLYVFLFFSLSVSVFPSIPLRPSLCLSMSLTLSFT